MQHSRIMDRDHIYRHIRSQGGRLTRVRKCIIDIFISEGCMLSYDDIQGGLSRQGLRPNRSTIFRELEYLTHCHIITYNSTKSGRLFEAVGSHHHHFVCLKCDEISKIDIHGSCKQVTRTIHTPPRYVVTDHAIELYGYCARCASVTPKHI